MKKQNRRQFRSSPKRNATQMTPKIISNMKENNSALIDDFNAPTYGLAPYANPVDNLYGAKGSIIKSLKACHAIFKKGVEKTSQRNDAIGASLFVKEVINLVKKIAGEKCYSKSMICLCLQTLMLKEGTVGVIILSKDEDQPRPCSRPRNKYYLIKK